MVGWNLHERVIPYVISVGLYSISRLDTVTIDLALIPLVERCKQEIYAFHLSGVEAAVIAGRRCSAGFVYLLSCYHYPLWMM